MYFIPREQRDPVAAAEMLRRLAFNGIDVHTLTRQVEVDGVTHPAGTWAILMDQPNANFVRQIFAVQDYPDLRQYPEGPPDAPYDVSGWTLPYRFDVRAGDLRDRYDVIVFADIRTNTIMDGFGVETVPPRYEGGIGDAGVRELDAFVRAGGTLVTVNGSSLFAIDALHLPVREVTGEPERGKFSLSGAILELLADPSHPVMSGVPERAKVMVGRSPVFTTEEGFEGRVLAKYPSEGSPLLSRFLLGEEHLHGYAAALEVRHGQGRVILLGMRPFWRGQPFGTFKILFNAALYSDQVAG